MITAVGLSNLQYVDLNSSRNIFILGLSLFFGLSFPKWISSNNAINTGSDIVDQIFSVLLGTSMFVGGMVGFILDNTVPGTDEERGLLKWRQHGGAEETTPTSKNDMRIYDIPLIQPYLNRLTICRYLPFCPTFGKKGNITSEIPGEEKNVVTDFKSINEDNARNKNTQTTKL